MQPVLGSSEDTEMYFSIPWLSGTAEGEMMLLIPSSNDA